MNKYFIRFKYQGIELSKILDLEYDNISIEYIQEKISKKTYLSILDIRNIDIVSINKL